VILFLDTSALVKLYIVEADSSVVHASVARAETVAVCRIAWAEACAALARRAREVVADEAAIIAARQALERDWSHFFVVEVTQTVVERAGEFAETFALRGYDSVQLAAAFEILAVAPGGVAFSCFDNRLNRAARVLGLDVAWPASA
jgi:predicted nucleic acid-binding protein